MTEPTERPPKQTTDDEAQERARAWVEQMKAESRLDPFDPIKFAVAAERARCVAIIRHHMESHRLTATIHSNPIDVARHEQAAAALETVLERIEDP